MATTSNESDKQKPTLVDFERAFIFDKNNAANFLGKGGFSQVYKCERIMDRRQLAVKVAGFTKESEKRTLLREANICAMVKHENIVEFIGIFVGPTVMHLVFEQVTGGELFDAVVKKSHFSEKETR